MAGPIPVAFHVAGRDEFLRELMAEPPEETRHIRLLLGMGVPVVEDIDVPAGFIEIRELGKPARQIAWYIDGEES